MRISESAMNDKGTMNGQQLAGIFEKQNTLWPEKNGSLRMKETIDTGRNRRVKTSNFGKFNAWLICFCKRQRFNLNLNVNL